MSQHAEAKANSRQAMKKAFPSLIVNWLVPIIVYAVLSGYVSDTDALAVSGAIPALWVIMQMLRVRRVDWIGVLGAAGFAAAYLISVLSGGGSMPLKLYHPVIACAIGLASLISLAAGKPLAIVVLRSLKAGDSGRFDTPAVRKKMISVTAVFGFVFLADGIIHIIMAFALSTGQFMVASKIVTIAMLAVLVLIVRGILWRKKARPGQ